MSFIDSVWADCLTPIKKVASSEWLVENFSLHTGEAFNQFQCPWVTAPQGPCWAYDSIEFRTIWLQWAARMFKTNFGLCMLLMSMDEQPEECMFATPDETNCKAVFSRLWKMIGHSVRLRDQAPIEARQNRTRIDLQRAVCHGAWPRGKSRLADKSIRVAHGNEIDKWVAESTSTEGDPIDRFRKRGAEYPDRKFVLESTPSVRNRSAVEAGRLASTNHRYHVPCPHCQKFQTIEFGDGSGPGMIHYDSGDTTETDIGLAVKSAHYVCLWCRGRIEDIHRPGMMNAGVWVPAGCKVDHERAMQARDLPPDDMSWLRGKPLNWGGDYGSQLSVFYALFHGWGDMVRDFLTKRKQPRRLQQWINEDKGETWEIKKTKSTPERIAERLRTGEARGVLPDWTRLVTVTVDQQAADGGYRVWTVLAHGDAQQAHVVDIGTSHQLADVWEGQIRAEYEHGDGGNGMFPHAAAVDSGWDTKATYDFCNTHPGLIPCKGSAGDLGGLPYKLAGVESGQYQGQELLTVNTDFWETDLQARLDERLPGEPGALSLFAGAEKDIEFLTHLCNATLTDKVDGRGNDKLLWVKKNENEPNDFRDAVRYGIALALAFVSENEGYPPRGETAVKGGSVVNVGESRPDGRQWSE
jgi:phage terminase large subunit GpA-like protein